MSRPVVNFLIAGTQKGGTTALAEFLSAHPDVGISRPKEVHFFDREENFAGGGADYDAYHEHFAHCRGRRVIGEATPIYMYLPAVPERLHAYNPDLRLLFALRPPWERAYAHYSMESGRGRERLSFTWALRAERWRLLADPLQRGQRSVRRRHSYRHRGYYSTQIRRFLRFFPREQLLFLATEDLRQHHEETVARIHRFLGVEPVAPPPARAVFEGRYPPMDAAVRRRLERRYAPELRRLRRLTGLDLGGGSWA